MTTYSKTSPYYETSMVGGFLDVLKYRPVPASETDTYYEIDSVYNFRPDLLAHDLYKNASLWWVFAARNPNTIKDPIFDFRTGSRIFIPKKDALEAALGI